MPASFKRNPRILSMVIFGLIWAVFISIPFVQTAIQFHYYKLTRFEIEWLQLFAPGFIPAIAAGYFLGPMFDQFFFLRSVRWQLLAVAIWSILAPIYVFLLLFRVEIRQMLNHKLTLTHMVVTFFKGYPAFAMLSVIIVLPVTLVASLLAVMLIKRSSSNPVVPLQNP